MAQVIVRDPQILGGEPIFRGTRVPFKILLDYLEGGNTLVEFLDQYPSVSRELAVAALEEARSKSRWAQDRHRSSPRTLKPLG